MRMLAAAATAALLSASGTTAAHPQQTQPPAFKSGVDLLTLQTTVLDKDGRPVTNLTPADFTVTVEGKPRKVLFARFRGAPGTAAGRRSDADRHASLPRRERHNGRRTPDHVRRRSRLDQKRI